VTAYLEELGWPKFTFGSRLSLLDSEFNHKLLPDKVRLDFHFRTSTPKYPLIVESSKIQPRSFPTIFEKALRRYRITRQLVRQGSKEDLWDNS